MKKEERNRKIIKYKEERYKFSRERKGVKYIQKRCLGMKFCHIVSSVACPDPAGSIPFYQIRIRIFRPGSGSGNS